MPPKSGFRGKSTTKSDGPFLRGFAIETIQYSGFTEHTINARRTDRSDIGIEHHERQAAITLKGILGMEIKNCFSLRFLQPVVARDRAIMFVDFSATLFPIEILAAADTQPSDDLLGWDLGTLVSVVHIIDDLVAAIMGNPASVQSSPSTLFS